MSHQKQEHKSPLYVMLMEKLVHQDQKAFEAADDEVELAREAHRQMLLRLIELCDQRGRF